MIRNNKGEFAQSKAKDTVVVLFTAFIMLGIAYYAHYVQAGDYDTRNGESTIKDSGRYIRHINDTSRTCIKNGDTTYCAPSESELIRGIQLDARLEEGEHDFGTKQACDGSNGESEENDTQPKIQLKEGGYTRKSSNPEIEAIIRAEAKAQGYADVELAIDIVDCESVWNPKATNNRGNTPSYSTDLGLWQYNDYWQRKNITKECMLDVACSTKQAIKDLKAGKAHQWSCYHKVR